MKIVEYKFNNTMYDYFPLFNEGYSYTHTESTSGSITTRVIESNNLPTEMLFGSDQGSNIRTNALLEVTYLDTSSLINTYALFACCQYLTKVSGIVGGFSKTNDMSGMFFMCSSLVSLETIGWEVGNVTTMESMFQDCESLQTLDLSNWNTANLSNVGVMFYNCKALVSLNLSGWNTIKIPSLSSMFNTCTNLTTLDLSEWDISNVENIDYVFNNCNSLINVKMINTNYNSANAIILGLPTKTESDNATFDISGIDDISQVAVSTASDKYWNIIRTIRNIKINENLINSIYVGDNSIKAVYIGNNILFYN